MNFELNHLKYFYYTVLEGGVSQAADRLCVQQPVVSKMLKILEENLGQDLFWKQGRSKSLTDYGQLIFRHCQVVFGELHKIEQSQAKKSTDLTGVLTVGGSEPIVNYLLPEILDKRMLQFPKLNFNVINSTQTQLLDMIADDKLDLGLFFYTPNMPKNLEVVRTVSFRFHLVIKSSLKKDLTCLQSFLGSREIDDRSSHKFPTLDLLKKKYPKARISFSSNSLSLHKSLVLKGKGVSILPSFMVKKELASEKLSELFPQEKFQWDLKIIKRKTKFLNRAAQALIDTF